METTNEEQTIWSCDFMCGKSHTHWTCHIASKKRANLNTSHIHTPRQYRNVMWMQTKSGKQSRRVIKWIGARVRYISSIGLVFATNFVRVTVCALLCCRHWFPLWCPKVVYFIFELQINIYAHGGQEIERCMCSGPLVRVLVYSSRQPMQRMREARIVDRHRIDGRIGHIFRSRSNLVTAHYFFSVDSSISKIQKRKPRFFHRKHRKIK